VRGRADRNRVNSQVEAHITAHLGDGREALANARRRHAEEGLTVLGLRFAGDPICRRARFDTLAQELGDAFEAIEVPDSAANPSASKPAHCVLTLHLIDRAGEPTRAALDRVIGFLRERLM